MQAGSERGGDTAASMHTLIGTAKLNAIEPQTWLADALTRTASMPITRPDRADRRRP